MSTKSMNEFFQDQLESQAMHMSYTDWMEKVNTELESELKNRSPEHHWLDDLQKVFAPLAYKAQVEINNMRYTFDVEFVETRKVELSDLWYCLHKEQ